MEQEQFRPLSGFRDYVGPVKADIAGVLTNVFTKFGYQALETPAIERQEILFGKLGGENQKQLYLFQDNGKRDVGLRYDLTVPLARFVAGNLGALALPFKRWEIGSVWRAEKPQKGRYRQFTQADVDIIGANEPAAELELLRLIAATSQKLQLPLVCRINDRRLVSTIMEHLKIASDKRPALLQLLDKQEKLTAAEFDQGFGRLGLSEVDSRQIKAIFSLEGEAAFEQLAKTSETPEMLRLKELLMAARKMGLNAVFAPAMVRGLDYYTGFIIECSIPDSDLGSLIGGGRYDSLLTSLTGQNLPAVGISFGIDRIADYLATREQPAPLFVARLPETSDQIDAWADSLRQQGQAVEIFLDEVAALGAQIKYADKRGYPSILIPFENEWNQGEIVRKFLQTGRQEAVKRDSLLN